MTSPKRIIIAIDGFASSGKSTLAKDLAHELGYLFIDTGAMYRGVAFFALENDLIHNGELNAEELIHRLDRINLTFSITRSNQRILLLNGQEITEAIRTTQVSEIVSAVAVLPEVRKKLVALQREMGKNGGLVMDGRDIGTVVFPNADVKIFVTADIDIRSQRRFMELKNTYPGITLEEVKLNLMQRDQMDTTRATSPLKQATDAVLFDTGELTPESQLKKAMKLVEEKLSE